MQWQTRTVAAEFETREENGAPVIEGYFAVFNSNYDICSGFSESIAPGAFSKTLSGDIRALINHDSTLVLGRTSAHTLELREDSHGLWGRILINPNDSDAMNLYERVKRGDISQCSFGFEILDESTEYRDDGSVHWTIREVRLYEVSCVTFPAYEETAVNARKRDFAELQKRKAESWRHTMFTKLKGEEEHGTESTDASQEA